MKQSGIPTIVRENEGVAAKIALPEVTTVSLSSVLGNYLAEQSEAALIALDINNRKLAAGASTNDMETELSDATDAIEATGQGDFKKLSLEPNGGQTGRSLTFHSEGTTGNLVSATLTAIAARLQPVAPKFTIESLVSMIASEIPSDSTQKFFVVINQEQAKVYVYAVDAGTEVPEEVTDLFDNSGTVGKIVVALADPTEDNVAPLAFEGGAV